MNPDDARVARLQARLPHFARKVAAAKEVIAETIADHPQCFVAYSGGKDSTALLWLAREVQPDIEARILLWPESELLGNFAEIIAAWRECGANIRELHLTRSSVAEKNKDKWRRLNDLAPATAVFIGLRASESSQRRIALHRYGVVHRRSSDGRVRVCPLAWWSTHDIAAAIHANNLPMLNRYDESIDVRTSTRVVARAGIGKRILHDMHERDPAAWARLRSIYPEDEI